MTDPATTNRPAPDSGHDPRGTGPDSESAVSILAELQLLAEASASLNKRTRSITGLGNSDMAALRHLLAEEASGGALSPKDIAERLEISTAAASGVIDRLEAGGYVERRPHPTDRRGIILVPVRETVERSRATLGEVNTRMLELAGSLAEHESDIILDFLQRMRATIEAVH